MNSERTYQIGWVWRYGALASKLLPQPRFAVRSVEAENRQQLLEVCTNMDFLVIRRSGIIDREIIKRANRLRLIVRAGEQCGNIDLLAAKNIGIRVSAVPVPGDKSVAEHVFLLALALYKKLIEADQSVRSGAFLRCGLKPITTTEKITAYNWMQFPLRALYGKTIGLIGLGEIGINVTKRARAFEMTVIYHKRQRLARMLENELGVKYASLRELLRRCDIVSLHLPLTAETYHIIGKDELALMKEDAVLINTSRGAHVDERALYRALRDKQIAGAGLDVFVQEPVPARCSLLKLKNIVLTPHIASAEQETGIRAIAEEIERAVTGRRLHYRVI